MIPQLFSSYSPNEKRYRDDDEDAGTYEWKTMSQMLPLFAPTCCGGAGKARCQADSDGSNMCKVKET